MHSNDQIYTLVNAVYDEIQKGAHKHLKIAINEGLIKGFDQISKSALPIKTMAVCGECEIFVECMERKNGLLQQALTNEEIDYPRMSRTAACIHFKPIEGVSVIPEEIKNTIINTWMGR